MIVIGICDDSKEEIKKLYFTLREFLLRCEIKYHIYYYSTGEELIEQEREFDLLFLDIEMDGINGIETGKLIRKKNLHTKIIYLTSFKEYQLFAFQVHAFQYIIKPYNKNDIILVMKELMQHFEEDEKKNNIYIQVKNEKIRLIASDIYYIEYMNRKVNIYTRKDRYVLNSTLLEIYEAVKRCNYDMPHKSFIVNLMYINSIRGYDIELKNGEIIPLSQKKAVNFRKAYFEFLQETYYLL